MRTSNLPTSIHYCTRSSSQCNRARKINKKGKEIKLSLFADDVNLYIENPKENTGKLL